MGRIKQEATLLALVLAMLESDIVPTKTAKILVTACAGVNLDSTNANRAHLLTTMRSVASSYRLGHAYIGHKHFVNDVLGKVDFFVSTVPLINIEDTI